MKIKRSQLLYVAIGTFSSQGKRADSPLSFVSQTSIAGDRHGTVGRGGHPHRKSQSPNVDETHGSRMTSANNSS
ncbi:hypothetical protein B0T10DRAFT_564250 [Thelonectria olida]|uniref:Uncharacterized protein n=1 Tax=Thelonectria olida TaxID=1576542 RepID=A0A9P8VXY7_9HYPO|nr:hypothetical protein B0T10DRAFT_564250 [Thelonectria olida]